MWNRDTAVDAMMHYNIDILRTMVKSESLDIYDQVPSALNSMTVPELVSWWIWHFDFNVKTQEWEQYTDEKLMSAHLEDAANEAEYYGTFG